MDQNIIEIRNVDLEIESLKARKDAIKKAAIEHRDTISVTEIDTNIETIRDIDSQIEKLEQKKKLFQREENQVNNDYLGTNEELLKGMEQRGLDLKAGKAVTFSMEKRTMTIAGSAPVVETKYSRELNAKPNEVSSLIDRVNAVPLNGGEAYEKGFSISGGEGDYTTETGDYNESDNVDDYVTIGKAKITVYKEISRDYQKLPNIDYASVVFLDVRDAIRKKITKQIVVGTGASNTIKGIYNADAKCIPANTDIEISAIDENTLNTIVFGLGGDEDVVEDGILILSKKTLKAFADVRGTNEKRSIYKITKKGNTGTIEYADGGVAVDYILNSACGVFSTATVGSYVMAYGLLSTYELPLFSDITVEKSTDYKFKQGMVCYRGDCYVGGSVAAYKSFVRIKKVSA